VPFHVLNRGNERRTLFTNARDFERFLDRVERTVARYPIKIIAYCLMHNHWHFVVIGLTERAISEAFQWLAGGHACELRRIENTVGHGHVYQRRFASFPIGSERHLLSVMRYVEYNACRAGLVSCAEEWRWGSLWDRLRFSRGILTSEPPVALPADWVSIVNVPLKPRILKQVRRSVSGNTPYGPPKWAKKISTSRTSAKTAKKKQ
jgi:putative transposase